MKRATLFLLAVTTASSCLLAQTTKNTFSELGYKKQITYTSSKGEFEEFHNNGNVVEIGSVYFNTKTNKVVGYINEEKENAEVASATSAMSVDPLCEKYYWISPYAFCFNNPVKYIDPDGREGHMYYKRDEVSEQRFALNYRNDNRIHIFSHGLSNGNGMAIYTDNGQNPNFITINNPERFSNLMEYSGSEIWSAYLKGENKTSVEVVLHGCETADLAKVLSETYPDVYFTGPNENNVSINNKELGPYKIVFLDFLFIQGEWETYQNGELTKATKAESAPPVDRQNGVEQPKDIEEYK